MPAELQRVKQVFLAAAEKSDRAARDVYWNEACASDGERRRQVGTGNVDELWRWGRRNDWFFLAMAHWKLNEPDKARRWYDQAVQWVDKHAPQNEFFHALGAEAKVLLQGTGNDPEPEK